MGFKKKFEKIRNERVKSQNDSRRMAANKWKIELRESSIKRDKLFREINKMSVEAKNEYGNFRAFDADCGGGNMAYERHYAALIRTDEGDAVGYMVFIPPKGLEWYWPLRAPTLWNWPASTVSKYTLHQGTLKKYIETWWNEIWSKDNRCILNKDDVLTKKWCILTNIWIRDGFRHLGLGSRFLQWFIEFCSKNGSLPIGEEANLGFHRLARKNDFIVGRDWLPHVGNGVVPDELFFDEQTGPTEDQLSSEEEFLSWRVNTNLKSAELWRGFG